MSWCELIIMPVLDGASASLGRTVCALRGSEVSAAGETATRMCRAEVNTCSRVYRLV
jgi:hypothetical protein